MFKNNEIVNDFLTLNVEKAGILRIIFVPK